LASTLRKLVVSTQEGEEIRRAREAASSMNTYQKNKKSSNRIYIDNPDNARYLNQTLQEYKTEFSPRIPNGGRSLRDRASRQERMNQSILASVEKKANLLSSINKAAARQGSQGRASDSAEGSPSRYNDASPALKQSLDFDIEHGGQTLLASFDGDEESPGRRLSQPAT